jgi:hypothetical protein
MARLFQTTVLICLGFLLTGCNAPKKDDALWKQVKIRDIAPSHNATSPDNQLLKTINLDIHIFEMPAEKVSALDDIWPMLHTEPLRFNQDSFKANLFVGGFGQAQIWNQIRELLLAAEGKRIERISLLLFDGQTKDSTIIRLNNAQTVFYAPSGGEMEGVTIGPGEIALRIKAEKIPGSRGVCNVNVQPVFTSPTKSPIPELAAIEQAGDFSFSSAGFELKMSPGDFVFLGPEKYSGDNMTLGSLFFSRPGSRPVVRTYLIICTGIND